MFTRVRLVVIFFLLCLTASAQEIRINLAIGGATYAMGGFKRYQQEIAQQFGFEPTITDEFPPYLFYEFSADVNWTRSFFSGVSVAYGSTGGRVQYRDYSGYRRADQLLRYINFAIPIGFRVNPSENFTLSFDLKPTFTRSDADLVFEQEVLGNHQSQTVGFKSQSVAVQPGVLVMRRIKSFGIYAQLSYYQTVVKGKMFLKENEDYYLEVNSNNPIHADWEGVRLSLGVSYIFLTK
jgi:hypothetical protein